MDEVTLNAKLRQDSGKGVAHKLRAVGRLPGVFYLSNEINRPIELDAHELQLVLKEKPSIIRLKLEGGDQYECIVRDLQRDPVSGKYLHVDLMGIVRGQKMTVKVPVELVGSAYGVRTQGGILQHMVHHINAECLPKDIPEKVTLDISELKIGDSLRVGDIHVDNIRILDEEDRTIVTVLPPRVEKEVVEEVEEEVEGEVEEAEGEEGETKDEDEEKDA